MPMMMMTTRSSMRVKPPSRSSAALRIRASIAVPFGMIECEPVGFVRLPEAGPRDWESGLGSWADSVSPLESPGFAAPPHDGCAFHLAVRLNDNECFDRHPLGLNTLPDTYPYGAQSVQSDY